ncbi:HlyD family secretion protein [Corallincola holothuriorum]|uniref:HlyD family secretion protein n=1 Tax=Corallincola holothuriorum TaxID=2282215 RepID=A0A368NQ09_9GAMM|nr:HlyD family efflux transporter periplasmic adaptor subunit [Corallincola holothuriorum]RCU52488.1 HlyD family secretion protein [Corallincola holothuriorum]
MLFFSGYYVKFYKAKTLAPMAVATFFIIILIVTVIAFVLNIKFKEVYESTALVDPSRSIEIFADEDLTVIKSELVKGLKTPAGKPLLEVRYQTFDNVIKDYLYTYAPVTLPFDSVVTEVYRGYSSSENILKGDVIFKAVSQDKVRLSLPVDETWVGLVKVDQPALIKKPGKVREYRGKVSEIEMQESDSGIKVVALVRFDDDVVLELGQQFEVKIVTGKSTLLDFFFHSLI